MGLKSDGKTPYRGLPKKCAGRGPATLLETRSAALTAALNGLWWDLFEAKQVSEPSTLTKNAGM